MYIKESKKTKSLIDHLIKRLILYNDIVNTNCNKSKSPYIPTIGTFLPF